MLLKSIATSVLFATAGVAFAKPPSPTPPVVKPAHAAARGDRTAMSPVMHRRSHAIMTPGADKPHQSNPSS